MILLVDDDDVLLNTCKDILEHHGFHVLSYACPLDAVTAFDLHSDMIKTVITDYNMPNMKGTELINQLRGKKNDFKAILLSGHFDSKTPENTTLLGKPFSFDDLINEVIN